MYCNEALRQPQGQGRESEGKDCKECRVNEMLTLPNQPPSSERAAEADRELPTLHPASTASLFLSLARAPLLRPAVP